MTTTTIDAPTVEQRLLAVDSIDLHPHNVRRDVGDVTSLAANLKAQGMLQAVLVVPNPDADGRFLLLAGHRRITAARVAGLVEVPATINHELADDRAAQIAVMLAENSERDPLSAAEEAAGVQDMLDLGESVATIAKRTGWTRTRIRQRARIAQLPESVREKVHTHQVSIADATVIASADPSDRAALEAAVGTKNWATTKESVTRASHRRDMVDVLVREARAAGIAELECKAYERNSVGAEQAAAASGRTIIRNTVTAWGSERAGELLADENGLCFWQRAPEHERPTLLWLLWYEFGPVDAAGADIPLCTGRGCFEPVTDGDYCRPHHEQTVRALQEKADAVARAELVAAATTVRREFLRTCDRENAAGAMAAFRTRTASAYNRFNLSADPEAFAGLGADLPDGAGPEHEQALLERAQAWLEDASASTIGRMIAWNAVVDSDGERALAGDFSGYDGHAPNLPVAQRYRAGVLGYVELLDGLGYERSDIEDEIVAFYRDLPEQSR